MQEILRSYLEVAIEIVKHPNTRKALSVLNALILFVPGAISTPLLAMLGFGSGGVVAGMLDPSSHVQAGKLMSVKVRLLRTCSHFSVLSRLEVYSLLCSRLR